MVNYKCPRCGFETNIKTKYVQHLKRKYICNSILNDNDLNEEYIKYNIKDKIIYKPQMNPNDPKLNRIEPKKHECEYCKKIYSTNSHMNRHLKICKERKKDEECKNDMLELINKLNEQQNELRYEFKKELEKKNNEFKKQLDRKDKQIDELIKKAGIQNSNITNNIQQNIKILAYKNTDLSHLTDNDYLKCLRHSNFCVPNLIETIHFNPKKPENHNVYISNIKNKYALVYDGNKWKLNNQNETINDLFDKNHDILEQKLEEWIENGKEYPEIMKKFNRYLEKKDKDEVVNKIKEEIKLILFNNRTMISNI